MKPARKTAAAAPVPAPAPGKSLRQVLVVVALCGLTLLAFANSFQAGFALDNKLILQDTRVHAVTGENLGLIFGRAYWWPRGGSALYRPLTTLSYLFNYAVLGDGDRPAGYHWVNLLLHLGNVLLVYALARKLLRNLWPAALLAGVWAVHPLLTESVTNIVGRADLLAGGALLAGLLLYLKSAEASGWRRFAYLAALMAVTAVGVFSKESAVVILGLIPLYELCWWRDRRPALLWGCAAVLVPIQAMLYERSVALATDPPAFFPFTDNPLAGAAFWQAKLTAIKVMAHYLGLAVWPQKLSSDYSYNAIPLVDGGWQAWACGLLAAALAAGMIVLYLRQRTAFFLAGFAFLAFLPASNLLFPFGTIMAERLLYVPLVGLLACAVLGLYAAGRRLRAPWLAPAVVGVLICGFTLRTWARNADWQDDLTLARAAVRSCPGSFKTHEMLADALEAADPERNNLSAELEEAEKALAILNPLPDSKSTPEMYRFAGQRYLIRGDRLRSVQPDHSTEDPLSAGQVAVQGQRKPAPEAAAGGAASEASGDYRRGLTLLKRGAAILEANRQVRVAALKAQGKSEDLLGTTPDVDIYRALSAAYERLGDGDRAFDAGMEALRREPLNPAVYGQLGEILYAVHESAEAARVLMEGMVVTSDMDLRTRLMDLFRSGLDTEGCAIVAGPYGPAINPQCPVVHQTMCGAGPEAIHIRLQTGRRDLAEKLKSDFLHGYGCPAGPLNEALPEGK